MALNRKVFLTAARALLEADDPRLTTLETVAVALGVAAFASGAVNKIAGDRVAPDDSPPQIT